LQIETLEMQNRFEVLQDAPLRSLERIRQSRPWGLKIFSPYRPGETGGSMERKLCIYIVLALFAIACEKQPPPPEKSGPQPVPKVVVEKEKPERGNPLPPEVKIKLKKDGKDQYSWELSGSDADQILKVNEKLRKQLGEPSK
jgi:hypothetical protein